MSANPWDRYADESEEAFAAFSAFKRLTPDQRTLKAAWAATHPDRPDAMNNNYYTWSKKYAWKLRAANWDQHVEKLKDKQIEQKAKQEIDREIDHRRQLLHVLFGFVGTYANALQGQIFDLAASGKDASALNPKTLREFATLVEIYNNQSRKEYPGKVNAEDVVNAAEALGPAGEGIREKIQQILSENPPDRGTESSPQLVQ